MMIFFLVGIMVTAKKRQEFRIKLQKRARRRGDKKVELLEEDKILKEVGIIVFYCTFSIISLNIILLVTIVLSPENNDYLI